MITTKTIIVCGATNTGTSIVAGTLALLKIPMGDLKPTDYCYENLVFAKPFFSQSMIESIASYNCLYKVWGWKFPFMRNWFDKVYPYLINPLFIYCVRDSLERAAKEPKKYNNYLMHNDLVEENAYWESFFLQHPIHKPLIIAFGLSKEVLFTQVCNFIGIPATKQQFTLYMEFNNPAKGYSTLALENYHEAF